MMDQVKKTSDVYANTDNSSNDSSRPTTNNNNTATSTTTNNNNNNNNHFKLHVWSNLAAYILNVAVTYTVGLGFLDLPSNGELSLKYQTLVTPVGWAFAIWGVIFTLQAVWVLLPLWWWGWRACSQQQQQQQHDQHQQQQQQQQNSEWITAVGYNYVYVCLAQAAWTLTFTTEHIGLSCVSMLLILWFLVRLVRPLLCRLSHSTVRQYVCQYTYTYTYTYLLFVAPFTVHLAWILAATFVNLNVWLVAAGQGRVGAVGLFYAAVTSLLILLATALRFLWRRGGGDGGDGGDPVIPTVLAWALLGIYVELGSPADSIVATFTVTEIDVIRYAAAIGAMILAVGVVVRTVRSVVFGGTQQHDATTFSEEGSYLRADE